MKLTNDFRRGDYVGGPFGFSGLILTTPTEEWTAGSMRFDNIPETSFYYLDRSGRVRTWCWSIEDTWKI